MRMVLALVILTVVSPASARRMDNIFAIGDSSTTSQSEPDNQDFDISFRGSKSNTIREGTSQAWCTRDWDMLLALEDVRRELQDVNLHYLENASVDRACGGDGGVSTRDASNRDCRLDFGYFSSNLHQVCEKHGGVYVEREHSIQCHSSGKKLYYQYDRFPNCFPASCGHTEVEDFVAKQMESVRYALENDSGMTCFADFDILRHAGEEDLNVSAAGKTSRPATVSALLGLVLMGTYIIISYFG
jgi:hypothetical protein